MRWPIEHLLDVIGQTRDCVVHERRGIPELSTHKLPGDLVRFYEVCGGVKLFSTSAYSIEVVSPERFRLATPAITGSSAPVHDISADWYVVATGEAGQFITIDLNGERKGYCHDSFWDRYANPGDVSIIAISFTELLERLVDYKGQYHYWLDDGFSGYGDAYDAT